MGIGIIFSNHWLNCAVLGWFSAQLIKGIIASVKEKKLLIDRFFGSGGMPSSHSAMVAALLLSLLLTEGFSSPVFAVAAAFSFITVYDAAGVRYEVGEQAKIINRIIVNDDSFEREKLFKELMGHTKPETFFGCLLGFLISSCYYLIFLK